jgi:membrane protease YdiL (CAAX protease family)
MRPLRALFIYLILVFLGGALLAPWLHRLAQITAASFPHLANTPFHRFLNRSLLLLALAGLWPLLRALKLASLREIGLVPPRGHWKKLGGGLLLGSIMLAIDAGLVIAGHGRVFGQDLTAHKIIGAVFNALIAAVVVAFLEEVLFRGGIFGGLRRTFYWPLALAASSSTYALTHFLRWADLAGPVTWNSGLVLLPRMLGGFADFHAFVPGFFNLLLAGILLGIAYQRTGNLYFSIGLHAGWIFWLKICDSLTANASHAGTGHWGTAGLIDGWLPFLVLAVTLAIFKFLPLKPAREPFAIAR